MANLPLAVLDTNVVILMATKKADNSPEEEAADERRTAVDATLMDLRSKVRFVIPAPVVAELSREGAPLAQVRKLASKVGRMRILPLDRKAAVIAAEMARTAVAARPKGAERGAVKYDTLICAIAHSVDARYLITDNARDMRAPLAVVHSKVEVVVATDPPETGQGNIFRLPTRP